MLSWNAILEEEIDHITIYFVSGLGIARYCMPSQNNSTS